MDRWKIAIVVLLALMVSSCQAADEPAPRPDDGASPAPLSTSAADRDGIIDPTEGSGQKPGMEVDTAAEAQLGTPFSIRVGDTVLLDGDFQISLQAVNDSRCPKDAMCIQAGWAEVVLDVKDGDNPSQTVQLYLAAGKGGDKPDTMKIGTRKITVVNVTPYPSLDDDAAAEKLVTLLVK